MKVWTVYGARGGESGFGWPPRRTGRERVAGSLLAPGLPQACLWLPGRYPYPARGDLCLCGLPCARGSHCSRHGC